MNYICYILYSKNLDRYYIGETENLNQRLIQHNSGFFKGCYTSKSSDWEVFHLIICETRQQVRYIENHLKKMKSRKYIENLPKYPEISEKLLMIYK